MLMHQWLA